AEILQISFDAIIDAIDSVSRKCVLLAGCRERGISVITVGAAGGRGDPTAIEVTDLAFSTHDRLLQEVRHKLRRKYNFPRGDHPFGIECVFSREPLIYPQPEGATCDSFGDGPSSKDLRLDCNSGFGTASFVTGTFGFVAASRVVDRIGVGRGCH